MWVIFFLSMEFPNVATQKPWVCTIVYGPNILARKPTFLEEIRTWHTQLPWVICGDFNSIFMQDKENTGNPNLLDIHHTRNLLRDFKLLEPPFFGRKFTWSNGQADPT